MNSQKYKEGAVVEFIDDEAFRNEVPARYSHGAIPDGPWWREGKYEGREPDFGRSYHRVSVEIRDGNGVAERRFYVPARRLRSRR